MSVRNAGEARTAVRCGAAVIDVKEPGAGPLGRPKPDVAEDVVRAVGSDRPVSIALGELADLCLGPYERLLRLHPIRFAKVGLAGSGNSAGWWHEWQRIWNRLPEHLGRVGVVYADWQTANAPSPSDALRVFAGEHCAAVLFDTYAKDGRSLFDFVAGERLSQWLQLARDAAPIVVLAGSLTVDLLDRALPHGPDYLGVRGAVCRTTARTSAISGQRIRQFVHLLRQKTVPSSP